MIRCDALVVGGGPAGSTCARLLQRAGWNVVVADAARFPRDKVCAGWLTPEVFPLLELDPADYRAAGLTLQEVRGFRTGVLGGPSVETRYRQVVSYAIRRCEFDHFLLQRSGARVVHANIRSLRRGNGGWVANEEIDARVLIGAGGHFCPVARHLRAGSVPPRPVVAKEAEFRLNGAAPDIVADMPELFFCRDLEGYAWCVRKGDYLNVGIGRRDSHRFSSHVEEFAAFLDRRYGLTRSSRMRWCGHAFLAAGATGPLVDDGALLVGDAAGVAYPESGEGIRPAIETGQLAGTLLAGLTRWDRDALQAYHAGIRRRHPAVRTSPPRVRRASAAAGRILLRSRSFTRHVVLNRWFLRAHA